MTSVLFDSQKEQTYFDLLPREIVEEILLILPALYHTNFHTNLNEIDAFKPILKKSSFWTNKFNLDFPMINWELLDVLKGKSFYYYRRIYHELNYYLDKYLKSGNLSFGIIDQNLVSKVKSIEIKQDFGPKIKSVSKGLIYVVGSRPEYFIEIDTDIGSGFFHKKSIPITEREFMNLYMIYKMNELDPDTYASLL